jgi:VIT1/CCC1 family predicted Fe2+/Mn2+ transporter
MRGRILDPVDRISEILFGLIMVLTSTNALSVISAGHADVRTMILGALGCNLAWGVIDGVLYLLGCLSERGRNYLVVRTVRTGGDPDAARAAIAELLPASVAAAVSRDDLEAMRAKMTALPEWPRPTIARDEWLGGLAVCLLVFMSTFPPVLPFLFMSDVPTALRVSNGIAIAMLFACGYAFARHTGLHPLRSGLVMVAIGCAMVGVAIALGG